MTFPCCYAIHREAEEKVENRRTFPLAHVELGLVLLDAANETAAKMTDTKTMFEAIV